MKNINILEIPTKGLCNKTSFYVFKEDQKKTFDRGVFALII